MKTVLELLKKYDDLNEAKIRGGGKLAPEDEERWEELKVVYDLLMFHSGLTSENASAPFSPAELRETLADETRLRVPVEAHAMVEHEGGSFDANVVNVSRGGIFLASEEEGIPEARIRRGMGIRLVDLSEETGERLESLVVKTIEKRLTRFG